MVIEWFYFSCENNPDDRTWMTDVAVHRKQFGHFSLFVRNPDTSSVGSCTKFRFHYSDQNDLKMQAASSDTADGCIDCCSRLHEILNFANGANVGFQSFWYDRYGTSRLLFTVSNKSNCASALIYPLSPMTVQLLYYVFTSSKNWL